MNTTDSTASISPLQRALDELDGAAAVAGENLHTSGYPATARAIGDAVIAVREAIRATLERISLPARRYERLRIVGVAPSSTPQLENRTCLCFQNLDDFVDADIKAHPSRGEFRDPAKGWEDAPTVRDQLWCLSTATLDAIRRDIDAGLTSSQIRDEIISKVGMMASARTPEMQARYDAALDREALARRPDPTRESVNRRVEHDLTVIAARMVRDYPGMPPPPRLNLGDIRRMANFVLAHAGEGPASPPAAEPPLDQPWVADLKKELAGRRAAAERAVSVKHDLAEQLFDAFWGTIVNAGWPTPVAWEALHESQRNAWRGVADAARRDLDQERGSVFSMGIPPIGAMDLGAAQLVYTAPVPKAEASPDLQTAIGEMDSGLNALVNELAPDVVQNLRTRFEDVLRHTNNQLMKPSHELEALRNFHERVTHSIRLISHIMRADTTAEEAFHQLAKEVLENNGQALMKPPPNSLYTGVLPEAPGLINSPQMPVTIRPDGAYTAGPPSDGRPVAEHLDELASGPAVKLVIDIARRVVSRGMHERTAGTAHGGFELLPNDINILTQLAKAVAALDKEKP